MGSGVFPVSAIPVTSRDRRNYDLHHASAPRRSNPAAKVRDPAIAIARTAPSIAGTQTAIRPRRSSDAASSGRRDRRETMRSPAATPGRASASRRGAASTAGTTDRRALPTGRAASFFTCRQVAPPVGGGHGEVHHIARRWRSIGVTSRVCDAPQQPQLLTIRAGARSIIGTPIASHGAVRRRTSVARFRRGTASAPPKTAAPSEFRRCLAAGRDSAGRQAGQRFADAVDRLAGRVGELRNRRRSSTTGCNGVNVMTYRSIEIHGIESPQWRFRKERSEM